MKLLATIAIVLLVANALLFGIPTAKAETTTVFFLIPTSVGQLSPSDTVIFTKPTGNVYDVGYCAVDGNISEQNVIIIKRGQPAIKTTALILAPMDIDLVTAFPLPEGTRATNIENRDGGGVGCVAGDLKTYYTYRALVK